MYGTERKSPVSRANLSKDREVQAEQSKNWVSRVTSVRFSRSSPNECIRNDRYGDLIGAGKVCELRSNMG